MRVIYFQCGVTSDSTNTSRWLAIYAGTILVSDVAAGQGIAASVFSDDFDGIKGARSEDVQSAAALAYHALFRYAPRFAYWMHERRLMHPLVIDFMVPVMQKVSLQSYIRDFRANMLPPHSRHAAVCGMQSILLKCELAAGEPLLIYASSPILHSCFLLLLVENAIRGLPAYRITG